METIDLAKEDWECAADVIKRQVKRRAAPAWSVPVEILWTVLPPNAPTKPRAWISTPKQMAFGDRGESRGSA